MCSCFLGGVKASPAEGWRRLEKNTDYVVLAPASFLTFGKVNPSVIVDGRESQLS